jgi:hypothetical protein
MAIGTLAAIGAGLGVAGGLARGIGGAVASRRSFSDEEERRLQQLVRDRAMGRLGLTEAQEGEIRSDLGGSVAQAQAGTEQAALRGLAGAGATGARDVFLARMAGQQRTAEAQREVEREVQRADRAMADAQREELRALAAQRARARAGAIEALTGGIAQAAVAGGEVALQRATAREDIALREANLGVVPDEDLLRQYRMSRSGPRPGDLARESTPDWSF